MSDELDAELTAYTALCCAVLKKFDNNPRTAEFVAEYRRCLELSPKDQLNGLVELAKQLIEVYKKS